MGENSKQPHPGHWQLLNRTTAICQRLNRFKSKRIACLNWQSFCYEMICDICVCVEQGLYFSKGFAQHNTGFLQSFLGECKANQHIHILVYITNSNCPSGQFSRCFRGHINLRSIESESPWRNHGILLLTETGIEATRSPGLRDPGLINDTGFGKDIWKFSFDMSCDLCIRWKPSVFHSKSSRLFDISDKSPSSTP